MSNIKRRKFLKTSGLLLGAAALGKVPMHCGQQSASGWDGFKYAMCNESMMDRPWADQCQVIADAGYTGVEIAPFTLVEKGVSELTASDRKNLLSEMQSRNLECVGLHWLLSPPPEGLHFTTPDDEVRSRTVDYLDQLVDFCADLNGEVMIFGSPGQRSTVEGQSLESAMQNFADGLARVADHAAERNVKVLVEPLSSDQTNVVNTLGEAMKIVNMVDHPAIQTMFDFHNTVDETEPMDELIHEYIENMYHVQIQEMDGTYLGTGDAVTEFVPAFQAFKDVGYDGWISLEVFDFEPGGEKIAEESMEVLQTLESKVT